MAETVKTVVTRAPQYFLALRNGEPQLDVVRVDSGQPSPRVGDEVVALVGRPSVVDRLIGNLELTGAIPRKFKHPDWHTRSDSDD